MPLEPLICRSRYGNVKESYKITEKFGESEKLRIFVVLEKTRCITCSTWNNKNRKIMKNDGNQDLNVRLKYSTQTITTISIQCGSQQQQEKQQENKLENI